MPRTRRPISDPEDQDLNLAPIMNMVVILIPLLLLSVVFVSVSVINVNAPSLAPSNSTEPTEPEGQKVTATISHEGFYLATRERTLPPVAGCPAPGPTICLSQPDRDLREDFSQVRQLSARGDHAGTQALLDETLQAYDWRQLYNSLVELKRAHPDEQVIHVGADPNIPYAAVVRLFDVSRSKLERDHYDAVAAFWGAKRQRGEQGQLFPDPIMSIPK